MKSNNDHANKTDLWVIFYEKRLCFCHWIKDSSEVLRAPIFEGLPFLKTSLSGTQEVFLAPGWDPFLC